MSEGSYGLMRKTFDLTNKYHIVNQYGLFRR